VSWAIWITGLPGSGKSAIARAAATALASSGVAVTVLELDAIRKVLTPEPTYSDAEREAVYRALAYMAAALVDGGVPVIVDATAHRRAWRALARTSIARFAEVQLECPLAVCRERERSRPRGHAPADIYARAGRPGANVPGVNVAYEPARSPELTIDTTVTSVAAAAAEIVALVQRRFRPVPRGPVSRRSDAELRRQLLVDAAWSEEQNAIATRAVAYTEGLLADAAIQSTSGEAPR
jgi:adenylylsulfate kinase